MIRILDGNKKAVKGVSVREGLRGVPSAPSDQNGLTWILVAPDVNPGKPVPIEIVNSGAKRWILANPADNMITIRSFGSTEQNIIPVTVIDRADPKLLINGQVLYSSAARIVRQIRPSQLTKYLSPEQTQAILEQEARRLGVKPRDLSLALDSWAKRAEGTREKATAALYEQKFHEASTLLAPYFEQQANQTFDVAVDLGYSLFSEGYYFEAVKKYEIAQALRPDDFKVLNDLGVIRTLLAQYKDAEALLDRSLEIMKTKLAPNDPEIATTWSNKARLFRKMNRFNDARQALDKASSILKAKFGPDSPQIYAIYDEYGNLYQEEGKHSLAAQNYNKSLEALQRNNNNIPQFEYLVLLMNSASNERDKGELDRSEVHLKEVLQLANNLIANGRIRPDHSIIASIHNEYSGVFTIKQMFEEAEKEILQARDIWSKSLGEDHPSFATALNNLAANYVRTHRPALALPLLQRVVSIHEKALGSEHPVTGNSLQNLADCYVELGSLAEAGPLFERAVLVLENKQGSEMLLANVHNNLGGLYTRTGKFDLAESHLKKAIELREGVANQVLEYTRSLINLGALFRIQKRFAEAEPLLREALKLRQESRGIETPSVVETLAHLGGFYFVQEKYEQALPYWQQAHRLSNRPSSSRNMQFLFAQSMNNLGALYLRMNKLADAEPLLKGAYELWPQLGLGETDGMLRTCERYATLLNQLGRTTEASAVSERARQIQQKLNSRKQ